MKTRSTTNHTQRDTPRTELTLGCITPRRKPLQFKLGRALDAAIAAANKPQTQHSINAHHAKP